MTKIKRNDPCICGSGKKYKMCCGKVTVESASQFSKEEWEEGYNNLLHRLVSYLRKNKFKYEFEKASNLFFQDQYIEKDNLDDDEELLFMVFMVNCYRYFSLKKTLTELFLNEYSLSLLPVERAVLKNLVMSKWQIFKVLEQEKENYNRIQDVFNDEIIQFTSIDKLNLPAGKIYTGLIFKMGEDYYVSGVITTIPEENLDLITSTMMEEFHKAEEIGESIEFSLFLKYNAHRIIQLLGYSNRPKIRNRDGSPIRFWSIVFQILNHEKLIESLKNDSMIQFEEDKYFTWLLKGKTAELLEIDEFKLTEPFTIFGNGRIEDDLLIIEVNSTGRMEVAVDYLYENYSEELSHVDTNNLGDVHSYIPQGEQNTTKYSQDQPSEEELRELEKFYIKDFYYNKWIYDPVPALGHLSPIEAFEENPEGFEDLLTGINIQARKKLIDIDDLRKHIANHVEIERDYQDYKKLQMDMIQLSYIDYLLIENDIDLSKRYKGAIKPYYDYLILQGDAPRIGEVVEVKDATVIVSFEDDIQELKPSDIFYRLSDEETDGLYYLYDKQSFESDYTLKFLRKYKSGPKYAVSGFYFHKVIFAVVDFVTNYVKEYDEMITCTLRDYSEFFPESKYYYKDKQLDISSMEYFQAMVFPGQFFSFDSDLSEIFKKDVSKTDRLVWYICYLIAQCKYTFEAHKSFDINDREIQSLINNIYDENANHITDEFDLFTKAVKNKPVYKQFAKLLSSRKSEPNYFSQENH